MNPNNKDPDMNQADTFPKLLLDQFKKHGSQKVAMRKKIYGIWKEFTWEDYYHNVKYLCLGLIQLGMKPGDKMAIIGDNDPEWYWGEMACQGAGAAVVGVYTECSPEELKYHAIHSDSSFAMAKDQEQVDKFIQIKEELPLLQKVIYWEKEGLETYNESFLMGLDEVQKLGQELEQKIPDLFEQTVARGSGKDVCRIQYTSGTTGLPKGAMMQFEGSIAGAKANLDVSPRNPDDDYLSYVPLAWGTEETLGLICQLLTGNVVNFCEGPETVLENTREISPQMLMYTSRGWETICSTVQTKLNEADWLKRSVSNILFPVGYKITEMEMEKKTPSLLWKGLFQISRWLIFRPIRDKVGLARVKYAITGGSALSPDVIKFFHAMGVKLKQGYAMTETGSLVEHRLEDIKYETVGEPLPGCEVKIDDDNQILAKTPWMPGGYYKAPGVFEAKLKGGYYMTGDAGYIREDGHLVYWDRVDDLMELKSGQKYPPTYIEGRLKFSPFIKDCMVLGGKDRAYVSVFIVIDYETVGKWAEKRGIVYTTFADLSQRADVYDLMHLEIDRVNEGLPDLAQVTKFTLLTKEFDPDESELTRTAKLKRANIETKYKELIEAIYSDKGHFDFETEVRYRDGRVGKVKAPIKIEKLDTGSKG
jgi:long-chain acyl-CoA synthetase